MPDVPNISVMAAPRFERGWRMFAFYSCALGLTGLVSMLFADLLWRTGWSTARTVLLVLFVILFFVHSHRLCSWSVRIFFAGFWPRSPEHKPEQFSRPEH